MSEWCSFIAILIIFSSIINLEICEAIITPDQNQPKPAYTSGIKIASWRNKFQPLTLHNYSKVFVHNNPEAGAQYVITQTERTVKVYPVYNGHSYGLRDEGIASQHHKKNRTIYKRKIEYKTFEVYEKCPTGATGQFVYASSCNQFLNCWKGRGVPQNCAAGTLFNPKTLECDFPDKVQCITGPRENTFSANLRVQKSVSQPTCPKEFAGLIPNYTDCSKFISCNNGQSFSLDCPPGTLFDTNQNICDYPYKSLCFDGKTGQTVYENVAGQTWQGISRGESGAYSGKQNGYLYQGAGTVLSGASETSQQAGGVHSGAYGGNTFQGLGGSQNKDYGGSSGASFGTHGYQQNINSNLDFGTQCHGGDCFSGQTSNTQDGYGIQGCNPSVRNCNNFVRQLPSDAQNKCNPQIQNCNVPNTRYVSNTAFRPQNSNQINENLGFDSSGAQGTGVYSQVSSCDPQTEHCLSVNTVRGVIYIPFTQNSQQSISQNINCNPARQNCKTGSSSIFISSQLPKCIPGAPNCEHLGSTVNSQSTGFTTGNNQQSGGAQSVGTVPLYDHSRGNLNIKDIGCDLRTQNCRQRFNQNYSIASQHSTFDQHSGQFGYIGQSTGQYGNGGQSTGQYGNGGQSSGQYGNIGQNSGQYGNVGQNADQYGTVTPTSVQNHGNVGQNSGHFVTTEQNHLGVGEKFGQSVRTECDPRTQICDEIHTQGVSSYDESKSWGTCNPSLGNCHNSQVAGGKQDHGSPVCPDGFQGLTKHPTDCKKFLNCANGQTFVQDCAPGTLFNPKINNCDFPYNVECGSSVTSGERIPNSSSFGQATSQDYSRQSTTSATRNNVFHQTTQPYEATTHSTNSQLNTRKHPFKSSTHKPYRNPVVESNRGESGIVNRPKNINIDHETHGPNPIQTNNNPDYVDIFKPEENSFGFKATTTRRSVEKPWPPPYPSTDVDADYVFEYEDGEPVTLEPDNVFYAEKQKKSDCGKEDFYCSATMCITKTMLCDGHRDCENGKDELNCEEYIGRFTKYQNSQLEVFEKQKWINVSATTCALLCAQTIQFNCRSFNFRRIDGTCYLSDTNIGLSGALRTYYPTDYFELKTGTVDCSDGSRYVECRNKKCITKSQVCDGYDDCGDRGDEKNCKPADFGYSIKLAGSKEKHEGRVEITAFGQTGYICDDKFGILDANVICNELGFRLGAAEFKGQSYFARDIREKNTLYMMDDVECVGNETSLLDCHFAGWGVHDCRDLEIAGIVCKTPQKKCAQGQWKCATGNECVPINFICDDTYDCSDDSDESADLCEAPTEIRLMDGSTSQEGRLEVKHNGVWGTICDDDFNEDAAKVVCQRLGYKGKSAVKKDAFFGPGKGPIWLDQVSCNGNETSLEECTHWDWGDHNCDHTEDVGVVCGQHAPDVPLERHSKQEHHFESDPGLPSRCGFRKDNIFLEDDLVHARVIGGSVAKKGDYPWQAALRVKVKDKSAHWCGAVVLSSKWILTAAHCLQGYTKGAYVIVAGEYDTDLDEGTEQQKYIDEFFVHENFRKGHKMNNDIAIIKLKGTGFILNDDIQPICLPDENTEYKGNCTISGFGSVKSGISSYSHNLMATWIPIHSKEICTMPHIYGEHLTDGMFCAGSLDGGFDACDGDSGGPLACLDQGVFTLFGITSWGQHCGYANKPGVYVKIGYYRKWIEDIIQKHL